MCEIMDNKSLITTLYFIYKDGDTIKRVAKLAARSRMKHKISTVCINLCIALSFVFLLLLSSAQTLANEPINLAPSRFLDNMPKKKQAVSITIRNEHNRSAHQVSKKWNNVALPKRNPNLATNDVALEAPEKLMGGSNTDGIARNNIALDIHNTISNKMKNKANFKLPNQPSKPNEMENSVGMQKLSPRVIQGTAPALVPVQIPTVNAASEIAKPRKQASENIRTILKDPIQRYEDKQVIGTIFADQKLGGGLFNTSERILVPVRQSLQDAKLITANILPNPADKSIPDLVESVIFSSSLTTASITTGSIRPQKNTAKMQQFAQNSQDSYADVSIDLMLAEGGALVQQDAVWRIFSDTADALGEPILLHHIQAPALDITLPYGTYIIHAAYGLASVHKTIIIARDDYIDNFILNAGGLKVSIGHAFKDSFVAEKAKYNIYPLTDLTQLVENQEPEAIVTDVPNGGIIRLNAGAYRIVSKYGEANAIIEAEIRVESGKLMEAAMTHRSGDVTLKLTTQPGGSALANTQWTILGASGDLISEGVGALSKHTLAIGQYTVVAVNGGQSYTHNFSVSLGQNPVVEVIAN